MAFNWEGIAKDFKETTGAYKGRWSKGGFLPDRVDFNPADPKASQKAYEAAMRGYDKGINAVRSINPSLATGAASQPNGLSMMNRNSALGQTHGFLSRSLQSMGVGESVSAWGAGVGMGAVGLGAASAVNNVSYSHPGLGTGLGVAGMGALAAAAVDPAMLGQMVRSGSKSIGKIGKSVAPGDVKIS